MAKPTTDELKNRFMYHAPDAEAREKHNVISAVHFELACQLVALCPEGRDLSLALTALEESRMRANAAIAMTQPLAS